MGKFGIHSGYLKAQNVQAGTVSVTVDASGDGTQAVTFKRKFKNAPVVLLTSQQADNEGTLAASSRTNSGFTCNVQDAQTTGDSVTIGYIAIDDPVTGFA